MDRPWIGVANAYNAIIPGHIHLRSITEAVKAGIYTAAGLPIEFPVIGVCDGIAMNHKGMKFSLPGRGSCAGMFTANTMNCMMEALGMALPGNGAIPAKRLNLLVDEKVPEERKKNFVPKMQPTDSLFLSRYRAFATSGVEGGVLKKV